MASAELLQSTVKVCRIDLLPLVDLGCCLIFVYVCILSDAHQHLRWKCIALSFCGYDSVVSVSRVAETSLKLVAFLELALDDLIIIR